MEMHLDSLGGWVSGKGPWAVPEARNGGRSLCQVCVFQYLQSDPTVTAPMCPAWASVLLTPLLSLKSPSPSSTSCPLAPSFFCRGVCSLLLSASLLLDSIACHVSLCVSHSRSSGKSGWPPGYPLSELPESSRCIRLSEWLALCLLPSLMPISVLCLRNTSKMTRDLTSALNYSPHPHHNMFSTRLIS